MEWPIFRGNLEIGDKNNNVAICTLWTPYKKIVKKVGRENFSLCGNLYSSRGINFLLRNLLGNPRIRYLIVCGRDLSGTGDILINFFKEGLDKNKVIKGSSVKIDSIPIKYLNLLRRKIKIFDMRGKERKIERLIKKLKRLPPYSKPIFIPLKEERVTSLLSEEVGYRVEGKIVDVWLKILDLVIKYGEEKQTEHGILQKELLNVMAVIKEEGKIPGWVGITKEEVERYHKSFFGKRKRKDVAYTYGERLFRYTLSHVPRKLKREMEITFNQISHVINRLRKRPYTRRAVAFTWKQEVDAFSENPPCLTQITWNVKNNKLHQTAIFRSHDIWGAWLFNILALRRLQKEIADKIGVRAGSLTVISNSAHVYKTNWKECENLLKKHYRGRILPFGLDERGYFIIEVKKGKIVVQHYLKDGRKSRFRFEGKNAQKLYREILNENLVSRLDHAAYLGHELARAENALKEKKKFIQDRF